mmetsp:Transcript_4191/g.10059  ORF Transcript_4191/g.10059 Transcript_4191/m.10059 type:complete len:246 (-) Transcript_4191:122-859(-)
MVFLCRGCTLMATFLPACRPALHSPSKIVESAPDAIGLPTRNVQRSSSSASPGCTGKVLAAERAPALPFAVLTGVNASFCPEVEAESRAAAGGLATERITRGVCERPGLARGWRSARYWSMRPSLSDARSEILPCRRLRRVRSVTTKVDTRICLCRSTLRLVTSRWMSAQKVLFRGFASSATALSSPLRALGALSSSSSSFLLSEPLRLCDTGASWLAPPPFALLGLAATLLSFPDADVLSPVAS